MRFWAAVILFLLCGYGCADSRNRTPEDRSRVQTIGQQICTKMERGSASVRAVSGYGWDRTPGAIIDCEYRGMWWLPQHVYFALHRNRDGTWPTASLIFMSDENANRYAINPADAARFDRLIQTESRNRDEIAQRYIQRCRTLGYGGGTVSNAGAELVVTCTDIRDGRIVRSRLIYQGNPTTPR